MIGSTRGGGDQNCSLTSLMFDAVLPILPVFVLYISFYSTRCGRGRTPVGTFADFEHEKGKQTMEHAVSTRARLGTDSCGHPG